MLAIILFMCVFLNVSSINENDYNLLPNKFYIDNYYQCLGNDKIFCKVKIKVLTPPKNTSNVLWTIIQDTKKDIRFYDHGILNYGLCLNKNIKKNNVLQQIEKSGLKTDLLLSEISEIICDSPGRNVSNFDLICLGIAIVYLVFIFYILYSDIVQKKDSQNNILQLKGNQYLKCFSLIQNVQDLKNPINNEDYQNLKPIQGIRTLNMMLIICCHTSIGFLGIYVSNTRYLEDLYLNIFKHSLLNFFLFLVQTNFIISAWLLSLQMHNLKAKKGHLDLLDLFFIILNRFLRLLPALLVIVFIHQNIMLARMFDGPHKELVLDEISRCQKNWWLNLLFLNNLFNNDEMCNPATWYVAADTQMYIISAIFLYFSIKLNVKLWKITLPFGILLFVVHFLVLLPAKYDGLLKIKPTIVPDSAFKGPEFTFSYASTISNFITYLLGLHFGSVYFWKKRSPNIINWKIKNTLYISTLIISSTAVLLSVFEYSKIGRIFVAVSVRPIFAFGVGAFLLIMSSDKNGLVRKFCESKILVILANFCYSVYLTNFGLVLGSGLMQTSLVTLSDFKCLKTMGHDIFISFLAGGALYLLVEQPFNQLQKILLLKLKNRLKKFENK